MIIVADTSALFAAFDRDQPEHAACQAVLGSSGLLISPLVLAELDHLTRRDLGYSTSVAITAALASRIDAGLYRLGDLTSEDLVVAQSVRDRYASLQLDLADAVAVAFAEKHRTNRLFTLDQRDFRAIRPLSRFNSFRLLPADGD